MPGNNAFRISCIIQRAQQALRLCHYLFKSEHRHVPLKACTCTATCPAYKTQRGLWRGGKGLLHVKEVGKQTGGKVMGWCKHCCEGGVMGRQEVEIEVTRRGGEIKHDSW